MEGTRSAGHRRGSAERASLVRSLALVFVTLLTAGTAMVLVVLPRVYVPSPADGVFYMDAFERALDGQIAVSGDFVRPEVLDRILCSAEKPSPMILLASEWSCGPNGGSGKAWESTAWIHPPTTFFIDAAMAKAIGVVVPSADPLNIARVLGGLWFALGGTLLVWLASLWGARIWPSTLALLAFLWTPTFVGTIAFVTPDRWVLLVASAVMLATTAFLRGRLAAPWLALAGVVAGGVVKQTFFLAALTGALLIATCWWIGRRRATPEISLGRAMTGSAWLLGGSAAGVLAWQLIKSSLGTPMKSVSDDPALVTPSIGNLVSLVFRAAVRIPGNDTGGFAWNPEATLGLAAVLTLLLGGAAFGALMYQPVSSRVWPMAFTGVVAVGLGTAVVCVLGAAWAGAWLPPAVRYAMPAFPAFVVPLLVVAQRRWLVGVLAAVAVAGPLAWLFAS